MSLEALVHPEWLAAAAALWLAAALAVALARSAARRRAHRLLGPRAAPAPLAGDAALLLALGVALAALLGPRAGERQILVPARGLDVVLLLDVSRSMDARDVAPSRLGRARRAAQALLAGLAPGDRAALAAFAGRGVLLSPLTPDRVALAELLAGLDSELVRPRGSDLGAGVTSALGAFEAGSERPRAIFVLSDGEDPARRSDLGAAAALRAEVRVHAAAIGSDAGGPIPDHGVPLRDDAGEIVTTRRDAARLARLANATGGELFAADAWGEIDVAGALAALHRDLAAAPAGQALRRVPGVAAAPLAAAAFAILALEGISLRRAGRARGRARLRLAALARSALRRRGRRAATGAGLAAAAALLVGAAPDAGELDLEAQAHAARELARGEAPPAGEVERLEARLRERPRDPELLIRLGVARQERGQSSEAARAFTAAALLARDPALAALAYYDLGVARLEAGRLAEARDAFFDALALAPGDREARFNLEWALRALAAAPPPPDAAPPPRSERPPEPARAEPDASGDDGAPHPGAAPGPSAEELRRWLERVDDDLGHALRSAAREPRGARREPGPQW